MDVGLNVDALHYGPAIFRAELDGSEALGCLQVLELLYLDPANFRVKVAHVVFVLNFHRVCGVADWCCFLCHVSSVEWGTDIFGSIDGVFQNNTVLRLVRAA